MSCAGGHCSISRFATLPPPPPVAMQDVTAPLPAGLYDRRVVPSPTFYFGGFAGQEAEVGRSVAPTESDLQYWVQELLEYGCVLECHSPWTTVIVQWGSSTERLYYRGGAGQWDLDFFPWSEEDALLQIKTSPGETTAIAMVSIDSPTPSK